MKWLILIFAILSNASANILIKLGVSHTKGEGLLVLIKDRWWSPPLIGGISCFVLALIAYSYVLSKMNLSIAYPIMTSAGFALIGTASFFLFNEAITVKQIFGFILMSLGIWLVAWR